jgi:predicted Zn-dependent protease
MAIFSLMVVLSAHGGVSALSGDQLPLPSAQVHPLPAFLKSLTPQVSGEDYFEQVQPTEVGYLVWSQFPVKVYIDPPGIAFPQIWIQAANQAIQEWQAYFPLEPVSEPTKADIILQAIAPQHLSQGRVRSAQTSYQLFIDNQGILSHRCTVVVRPNQTGKYLLAALRHELGHALGIWGHSPRNTDALYFAQVAQPPLISRRDLNTLRRVYQQPTRLGWPVSLAPQPS